MASPEEQALLAQWRTAEGEERNRLLDEILDLGLFPRMPTAYRDELFPEEQETLWETRAGVYPDYADPNFIPKLMRKREFQESKQESIREDWIAGVDKCRRTEDFELSPVQRFVSRLLSPRTPYRSALLFHGVGVGKTCAAITIAESYLDAFPRREVFIVAPPNIQSGFERTIFDMDELRLGEENEPNHQRGCTGDIYLKLTGNEMERDREKIQREVTRAVNSRYKFFGYTAFYNYIQGVLAKMPKTGTPEELEQRKRTLLRQHFSNRLLIVDEAHNLRDNPEETAEDAKDDVSIIDTADSKGGKKLTPLLLEVLEVAEGLTLVLMTATPMYNSYLEILFLFRLMLTNDKLVVPLAEDIFDKKTQDFRKPDGRRLFGEIASQYVSFMRGENPLTFPIRLEPQSENLIRNIPNRWPGFDPKGEKVEVPQRIVSARLPCLACYFSEDSEAMYSELSDEVVNSQEGLGITNLDTLVQAGNWIFPSVYEEDTIIDRIRQPGFDAVFDLEKRGERGISYRCDADVGAGWLLEGRLAEASGKCATLLQRVNNCRGVCFVYSRFVASGALSIALALEANGYTAWGRDGGLLADGNQHPGGRQCALCPRHEKGHGQVPEEKGVPAHTFKPAKYVLLTGNVDLSPNNAKAISAARAMSNADGGEIKVILGSQVAGEGLDLRFIREILVFDSWYHLNKLEQVIGRGIRTCSHAALGPEKRNCTITLLVNTFRDNEKESVDMYSYRLAMNKAIVVGRVTRALKENAIDCSLNHDAIVVKDLPRVKFLLDSQGDERRDTDINDKVRTSMCDWLASCDYECKDTRMRPTRGIFEEPVDFSTYDEFSARYQKTKIKEQIRELMSEGLTFISGDMLASQFEEIPRPVLDTVLEELVAEGLDISSSHGDGRLVYKHGYYVFQPEQLERFHVDIPIAVRSISYSFPRDKFEAKPIVIAKSGQREAEEEESEQLWTEVKLFAKQIQEGTLDEGELPDTLDAEMLKLADFAGVYEAQIERLEMIYWLYSLCKGNEEARRHLASAVEDFFWDEYVPTDVKREILLRDFEDEDVRRVAADAYWVLQGKTYLRLLNGKTNTIEYFCIGEDGIVGPCPRAVADVLATKQRPMDPLLQRSVDKRFTGFEFGFLSFNPKKKMLVFRKGKAPNPGGKLEKGAECAINSSTIFELTFLEKIGKMLEENGKFSFGLRNLIPKKDKDEEKDRKKREHMIQMVGSKRPIGLKNSVRVCAVSDFILRVMDKQGIQGKRWFYRPLEVVLQGFPVK